MDLETLRRHGHELVDWMVEYLATVEDRPVRAQVAPGEVDAKLPSSPPQQGEPFAALMRDVEEIVLPGLTHWQHPRFFAYFPANSSPPSLLAEMLTATLAPQCMLWQTSPAATEMETRVLDWLRQACGLPDGLHGVIQDSASSATLCAILTARERATDWIANERGLRATAPLAVYTSREAHSSVEKAVAVAGLGRQALRPIECDGQFAMRPEALRRAILDDRAEGVVPACVVASLGTTGVGAFDPLAAIGAICREHCVFLHVDAAWAGSAFILPEERGPLAGVEHADSYVFNPHKWLMTNFDCSAHYVRDRQALTRTLSVLPAYLQSAETGSVIDYRDWSVPLGRRFRALKLWFVLRSYGIEGLQRILRDHITWTGELAGWIDRADDFELTSGPNLALVSFRWRPPGIADEAKLDALNQRLIETINADGRIYLTQNRLVGRFVIRVAIGQTSTARSHVAEAWHVIRQTAARLAESEAL